MPKPTGAEEILVGSTVLDGSGAVPPEASKAAVRVPVAPGATEVSRLNTLLLWALNSELLSQRMVESPTLALGHCRPKPEVMPTKVIPVGRVALKRIGSSDPSPLMSPELISW